MCLIIALFFISFFLFACRELEMNVVIYPLLVHRWNWDSTSVGVPRLVWTMSADKLSSVFVILSYPCCFRSMKSFCSDEYTYFINLLSGEAKMMMYLNQNILYKQHRYFVVTKNVAKKIVILF